MGEFYLGVWKDLTDKGYISEDRRGAKEQVLLVLK